MQRHATPLFVYDKPRHIEDPRHVARRTVAAIAEWEETQSPKQVSTAARAEHWLKPEVGWCKANADRAFHATDSRGGGVVRDHHGGFIAGAGRFFHRSSMQNERSCLRASVLFC
jgi:hypothetical protein